MITLALKAPDLVPGTFGPENKGRKGTYLAVHQGE